MWKWASKKLMSLASKLTKMMSNTYNVSVGIEYKRGCGEP